MIANCQIINDFSVFTGFKTVWRLDLGELSYKSYQIWKQYIQILSRAFTIYHFLDVTYITSF